MPHRVSVLGQPEPRRLGDLLKRLLKGKRFSQKGRYGALSVAWRQVMEEVLGEECAGQTRIGSFSHGRVVVEVEGPVLLQELSGFLRQKLLERLRSLPGTEDVADLRFRLGQQHRQ